MSARPVELFVDPACPFAWMTSRWLLQAAQVREIAPTFSVMSLFILNQGRELDPEYRRTTDQTLEAARLAIEIARTEGTEAFARWYTAWGERFHVGGRKDRREVAEQALAAAELPASLMDSFDAPGDAVDADETGRALLASHERAISMVGQDVGTPVISFGQGTAYFGPVVSPAPKGEDAGQLLDALGTMATLDGFYELKRTRGDGVDFS